MTSLAFPPVSAVSTFTTAGSTSASAAQAMSLAAEPETKREVEEFIEWEESDEKLIDAEISSLKGASSEIFLKLMRKNFVVHSFQNSLLSFGKQDKAHFRRLGNCILSELPGKVKKVVLIGPGSEPIPEIASKCEELVLVDYNPNALRQAAKAVPAGTKVTLIQADLTGGLYQQMSEGCVAWMSESSQTSLEPFLKALTNFKLSFFKHPKLKDADLVISSLLASQLVYSVAKGLNLFTKKAVSKPEQAQFQNAFMEHFNQRVSIHHINQIMQWGHRVLFIDTTVRKFIIPYTDFSKVTRDSLLSPYTDLFPKPVMAHVRETYRVLRECNWSWLQDPRTGKGFSILALSLTTKSKS